MKKYLPSLLILFTGATIALGCNSIAYAQGDYGNYDNGYDNNYDNGNNNSYDNSYDYNNNNYDQSGNGGAGVQISFNDFYSQLAPYGRWVMDPNYGRVWIANVRNFQPYSTNGYWTYTNYGWTWVSNYNWGWAPFHYGRWGFSNINGWFWVPGYEWGPAWVGWSSNADMYGWAPLAPGTSIGVSFSIGSIPINFWTFMPRRYLGYHNIHNYYIPRNRYRSIIRRSNIISNYRSVGRGHYALGPQPREVSRSTGRAVRTTRIVNATSTRNTGVRNNELHMYRPAVRGNSSNTRSSGNVRSSGTTPTRSNSNVQRSSGATRSTAPTRSNTNTRKTTTPTRTQRATTTQQRAAQQRATQQRAAQERSTQQRASQQRAAQQRAAEQRASQQRATQQRAAQQKAAQQRATQQRAAQQRATQQRAERATQRARQQQTQRAERTQQRVERVQQRSNTRSNGSSSQSRKATRSR
jgi:hypothetical protein